MQFSPFISPGAPEADFQCTRTYTMLSEGRQTLFIFTRLVDIVQTQFLWLRKSPLHLMHCLCPYNVPSVCFFCPHPVPWKKKKLVETWPIPTLCTWGNFLNFEHVNTCLLFSERKAIEWFIFFFFPVAIKRGHTSNNDGQGGHGGEKDKEPRVQFWFQLESLISGVFQFLVKTSGSSWDR